MLWILFLQQKNVAFFLFSFLIELLKWLAVLQYWCSFFIFFSGVLACSLTVLSVHGLYSAGDDVVELNPSNFNREVMQSDSLWLVEFYAPW